MPRRKAQTWKPLDIETEWGQKSAAVVSNDHIGAVLSVFPCMPSQRDTVAVRIRDVVDILFAEIHARTRPTPGDQKAALAPLLTISEQLRDGLHELDADSRRALSRVAGATSDRPATDFPPLPGLDMGALKIGEVESRLVDLCSYIKAAADQEHGAAGRRALDAEKAALSDLLVIWRKYQIPGSPRKPSLAEFSEIVEAVIQPVRAHFKQSGSLSGIMRRMLYTKPARKLVRQPVPIL